MAASDSVALSVDLHARAGERPCGEDVPGHGGALRKQTLRRASSPEMHGLCLTAAASQPPSPLRALTTLTHCALSGANGFMSSLIRHGGSLPKTRRDPLS